MQVRLTIRGSHNGGCQAANVANSLLITAQSRRSARQSGDGLPGVPAAYDGSYLCAYGIAVLGDVGAACAGPRAEALEVNVADVVEVRRSGSPVPPAHSAIRLSGDGADLIDAFLEDAEGVVAAGSFVP